MLDVCTYHNHGLDLKLTYKYTLDFYTLPMHLWIADN